MNKEKLRSQKTKLYETLLLTKVEAAEDQYNGTVTKCKDIIEKEGKGEWLYNDDWGNAKISYAIDKNPRARWSYFRFKSESTGLAEMQRTLKLNENVLRVNIFRCSEDGSDYDTLRKNISQELVGRENSREQYRERKDKRGFKKRFSPRNENRDNRDNKENKTETPAPAPAAVVSAPKAETKSE